MFIQSCKHFIVLYHVKKNSFHFCELYWVPFRLAFLRHGLPGEYGEWTPTSHSLPEREGSGGSSQAHDRGEGVSIFREHSKANGFNSPRSPALQEPRGEMIWQCPVRVHWLRSCLVDWHSVMVAESWPTCAHSNYFRLRETVGFSSVFFGVAELTIEYSRIRMNLAPILCFLFSCLSSSSSSLSALPFYAFFIPLIFIFEVTSSAFGILLVSVLLFQISIVIVIVMTCEQEAKLSV